MRTFFNWKTGECERILLKDCLAAENNFDDALQCEDMCHDVAVELGWIT